MDLAFTPDVSGAYGVFRASRVLKEFSVVRKLSTDGATKEATATTFLTPLVLASPRGQLPPRVAGFSALSPPVAFC